jgi:hypothetical protein
MQESGRRVWWRKGDKVIVSKSLSGDFRPDYIVF